jgi:multicomponent Na+:H+ antiporter subunit B
MSPNPTPHSEAVTQVAAPAEAAVVNAEAFIMMAVLTLLAVITLAIIKQRNLFGVVILSGIYSFLMASLMMVLDAVDVAMTEASVGAGISTVLLLATLHLTGSMEYPQHRSILIPAFVSLAVGAILVWGTMGLPAFGIADAPIHQHVAPTYIEYSKKHEMPPNMVTAVLADFRSFDTFGETTVVFTAGIGVLLLLQGGWRATSSGRRDETDEDEGTQDNGTSSGGTSA